MMQRRHVDLVDVGPLLAVDLDVDEQLVHHARGGVVLEALVRHDVAPVAGRVADREQDRLARCAWPRPAPPGPTATSRPDCACAAADTGWSRGRGGFHAGRRVMSVVAVMPGSALVLRAIEPVAALGQPRLAACSRCDLRSLLTLAICWHAFRCTFAVARIDPSEQLPIHRDQSSRHHLRPLLRPAAGGDRGGAHLRPARRRGARSADRPRARAAPGGARARARSGDAARSSTRRWRCGFPARTARPARTWPSCSCTAAAP